MGVFGLGLVLGLGVLGVVVVLGQRVLVVVLVVLLVVFLEVRVRVLGLGFGFDGVDSALSWLGWRCYGVLAQGLVVGGGWLLGGVVGVLRDFDGLDGGVRVGGPPPEVSVGFSFVDADILFCRCAAVELIVAFSVVHSGLYHCNDSISFEIIEHVDIKCS